MAQNIDCWLGSFVIFQGIRTSFANLLFFRGGGGPDPRMPGEIMGMHRCVCVFPGRTWIHCKYTGSLGVLWLSISTRCQFTRGVDAGNNQRH